MKMIQIGKVVC